MDTRVTSIQILRVPVGIAALGTITLLVGLAWDAQLHAADPDLAASESVFDLTNPSHLLAALGVVLVTVGVTGASSIVWLGNRSAGTRVAGVAVVTVGALTAGGVAVISTAADAGHAHGGERHHQARDYQVLWEAATKDERAAATRLVNDTRAAALRYGEFEEAQRAGYRANPRRGKQATHHPNPGLMRDGKVLDPSAPESLVYWTAPDGRKVLVGVVYKAGPSEPAPAPGGELTVWHTHAAGAKCHPALEADCPKATAKMLHVFFFDGVADPFADSMVAAAGGRDAFARAMRGTASA